MRRVHLALILQQEQNQEEKRKEHQRELAGQLNEIARQRLAQQKTGKKEEKARKSNISYKNYGQVPSEPEIKELKIYVGMLTLERPICHR